MKRLVPAIIGIILLFASCSGSDTALETEPYIAPEPEPEITNDSPYFTLPHEFTAADLYGNTVTHETLGEKQVFFVHLWATWCGPCVRGMPDLAEIARDYADGVGFVGLLLDFDSNPDGAKNIIESAGVPNSFVMLDANDPALAHLLEMVSTGFVPSTVLITKENLSPAPLPDKNYTKHLDEALS
jgi:thiol-disulfide isomerase/thioredoxin